MAGFVGRSAELERLRVWTDEVAESGVGRFVLVTGIAGAGKSSICGEFARRVSLAGVPVAWSRCWIDGTGPPTWPWPELVDDLASQRSVVLEPVPEADARDRFRLFRSVVQQLRAVCLHGPAVVLIDDLHTAGGDVVLLTRFVARSLHRFPMLLVATWRQDESARGPAAWPPRGLEHDATLLDLQAFSADEVAEFLRSRGVGGSDPETVSEVLRLTGGHPMHLEVIVEHLGRRSETQPEQLGQVMRARISACPEPVRAVLEALAVLGPACTETEVAALLQMTLDDVRTALDDSMGVAVRVDGSWQFAHELLRQAVLDQTLASTLQGLHRRAVGVIVGNDVSQCLRRARHAVEGASAAAKSRTAAAHACAEAARALRSALALEPAAEWASRGAQMADGVSAALEAELLLIQAEAVQARGWLSQARRVYDAAVAAAERSAEPRLLGQAALGLGGVWVEEQRDELERRRMLGLCRRAAAGLPLTEAGLAGRLQVRITAEEAYDGAGVEPVTAAVDAVRALAEPEALSEALSLYHHVLMVPGQARSRIAVADELLDTAGRVPGTIYGLFGLCWRTVDLYLLGDREADRSLADLRHRASAVGSRSIGYIVAVLEVMRTFRRGDLAGAEAAAVEARDLGVAVGDADALSWFGAHLLGIRWVQGRLGEMADLVSAVVESGTLRRRDMIYPALLSCATAMSGDRVTARASLDVLLSDGLEALPDFSTWTTTMAALVETASELGDGALAQRLVDRFEPFAELPVMPSLAVMCLGPGERVMAVGHATAGRFDTAIEWFEAALDANRRLGSRPFDPLIHAGLADALRRRGGAGDHRAAGEHFAIAVELGRELGMTAKLADWGRHATVHDQQRAVVTPVRGLLQLQGGSWRLETGDRSVVLGPLLGLHYIAELLSHPDTDVSARRLSAVVVGVDPPDGTVVGDDLLDARALSEYRRRIDELDQELDAADVTGDANRAERAAWERGRIIDALRRDTGLGGRSRRSSDEAERARMRVSKAVRRAVASVTSADPVLGHLLQTGIRTGYVCRYVTDPGRPITWTVRRTGP